MGWWSRVIGGAVAISCVACAGPSTTFPDVSSEEIASERRKQQVLYIQTYFSRRARLNNVAHRIAHAGRADCKGEVEHHFGFHALAPNDLPERYKAIAVEALGLDAGTSTVLSVAEGSPAAQAGIAVGDELVSFNGRRIPRTKPSDWIALFMLKNGDQPVSVEVRRAGQTYTRIVSTVTRCSIPILLATEHTPNAYTDGQRIVILSGMLELSRTDDELATIVGHELAHVTMGHLPKQKQNQTAGKIGGAIVDIGFALLGVSTGGAFMRDFGNAGALAHYTNFEREADYVGAYYAARAGYDLSAAERVWRAMAQESPKSMVYAGLHPTTPERFLLMQKTKEEIAEKKRRNAPLDPEPQRSAIATAAPAPPEQSPAH